MIQNILQAIIIFIITGFLGLVFKMFVDLYRERKATISILRADMVKTYYRYAKEKKIPIYIFRAWFDEYEAYKGLHGNSFIDELKKEIEEWEVLQ